MSYCKRRAPCQSRYMTTTYMVSHHDADDQKDLTENEEKVSLEETKVTKEEENEIYASKEAVALCAHCREHLRFLLFFIIFFARFLSPNTGKILLPFFLFLFSHFMHFNLGISNLYIFGGF